MPSRHRNQGLVWKRNALLELGLPAVDADVQSKSESMSYISYIEKRFVLEMLYGSSVGLAGAVGTGRTARVRRNGG